MKSPNITQLSVSEASETAKILRTIKGCLGEKQTSGILGWVWVAISLELERSCLFTAQSHEPSNLRARGQHALTDKSDVGRESKANAAKPSIASRRGRLGQAGGEEESGFIGFKRYFLLR